LIKIGEGAEKLNLAELVLYSAKNNFSNNSHP
jgi:hypothetical protein